MDPTPLEMQPLQIAAWVGLDWADENHALCLIDLGSMKHEASTVEQTPEALDAWATGLRQRLGGRLVGVCLEQRRGAVIYALMKYDFIVLYPLNPAKLASYREAMANSGAKDDPTDAELLAVYALHYHAHLHALKPDDAQTRLIRILVEDRRKAIAKRTQLTNELTDILKSYFPQALDLAGDVLHHLLACNFLRKWPSLEAVKGANLATIRKFYYAHNCRRSDVIEARLKLIQDAKPLTTDQAIIEAAILKVRMLVKLLRQLIDPIDEYDRRLEELMRDHADAPIFRSLPGAGPALAPRLLAAFGTDRDAFESADQVQTTSGIAPITKRSGKICIVRRRWACSKFLRQSFHEFAAQSIKFSTWAKAYYLQQKGRGLRHHAAVRALAFKWIRVIFRCWKSRTPYDEATYLASLHRRNSPLLKCLQAEAPSTAP
jgi:transposase